MLVHVDTDVLVHAIAHAGPERARLSELAGSADDVQMSAVAWYEFCRGPRTPEQLAVARELLEADGVISLSEAIAQRAAEVFRELGQPRRRAADIAIGVTALVLDALLLTRNRRDFEDIPGLVIEDVLSSS